MAIPIIRQTARLLLRGLLSGGLGGLVGGYLNVIAINFYGLSTLGHLPDSFLFYLLIPLAPFGLIIGFLVGGLIGGIFSLTPLTDSPHLLFFARLSGSILVAIPTTRFLEPTTPPWLATITMLGSLSAGFIGGTLSYRSYQRLFA
jgi:hypothetical protein